jgi:hypothetical protein
VARGACPKHKEEFQFGIILITNMMDNNEVHYLEI